jgi:hypothetical protein
LVEFAFINHKSKNRTVNMFPLLQALALILNKVDFCTVIIKLI